MNNLKEFKELIKTYEDITVQDIKDCEGYRAQPDWGAATDAWASELVMEDLTGFGTKRCSLCVVAGKIVCAGDVCWNCIWTIKTGQICYNGPNKATYDNFSNINIASEEELVEACKARAEYMRDVLTQNDIK